MDVKSQGWRHMNKKSKNNRLQALRFPEFRDDVDWNDLKLSTLSERITDKVGEEKLTTVSITAGFGFVTQVEKFSRDISGKQYKSYIVLKNGEFSYNKGNSKKFPQGCIYKLVEFDRVAAPSAFISFRIKDGFVADFFQVYFDNNYHGNKLQKFITSGARSDGLLNISPKDFFSIKLPTPSLCEQEKIADCFVSLNDLILAQAKKTEALEKFKWGLLQQIFPQNQSIAPRLRFPEFRKDGNWKSANLGDIGEVVTGSTPKTADSENYGGKKMFVSPGDIGKARFVKSTKKTLSEIGFSKTRQIPAGSIMFVCIGSTIGKVAQSISSCATNQQINSVSPSESFCPDFVYYSLTNSAPRISNLAGKQAIPIINKTQFSSVSISFPALEEQMKIADCLGSLDEVLESERELTKLLKIHKRGLYQRLFPIKEGHS